MGTSTADYSLPHLIWAVVRPIWQSKHRQLTIYVVLGCFTISVRMHNTTGRSYETGAEEDYLESGTFDAILEGSDRPVGGPSKWSTCISSGIHPVTEPVIPETSDRFSCHKYYQGCYDPLD